MTEDEEKKEVEKELAKVPLKDSKKAVKKDEETDNFAKDFFGKADKPKTSKSSDSELHAIMQKFDSGKMKLDALKKSLEDYFKKESSLQDFFALDAKDDADATCKDTRDDCQKFSKYCKSHAKTMQKKCAKTCNFCCNDKLGGAMCKLRSQMGYCENKKFKSVMKESLRFQNASKQSSDAVGTESHRNWIKTDQIAQSVVIFINMRARPSELTVTSPTELTQTVALMTQLSKTNVTLGLRWVGAITFRQ
eukprot:gene9928-10946_t